MTKSRQKDRAYLTTTGMGAVADPAGRRLIRLPRLHQAAASEPRQLHPSYGCIALRCAEWKHEWGGYKGDKGRVPFKRLPFHCCAITFTPFEDPVATDDGTVRPLGHQADRDSHQQAVTGPAADSNTVQSSIPTHTRTQCCTHSRGADTHTAHKHSHRRTALITGSVCACVCVRVCVSLAGV